MPIGRLIGVNIHIGRLREIVTVLTRYGLADWLSGLDYEWLQDRFKGFDGRRIADLTGPQRLRMAMTELGPSFIKLGQLLSTRPDLVGPDVAEELEQLQEHTPPDDAQTVRRIIEEELGQPVGELFERFEDEPVASASIAQAHRAVLKGGFDAIIKVQHDGIESTITEDLEIVSFLAELAERHAESVRAYQPVLVIAEFRRRLLQELDFSREMANIQAFRRSFEGWPTIRFPDVFEQLCTQRVLTMERLDGVSITESKRLAREGVDLKEFAHRGARMYLKMIFQDGFFHADPHPGNLMYLPGGIVGVLDCGMVGRLDDELRGEVESLMFAAVERDATELTEVVSRIGAVPSSLNRDALRAEVSEFFGEYMNQSLDSFDMSGALENIADILRRYRIVLPPALSLLIKTMVVLEGTGRRLNPDFSLAQLIEPYYRRAMIARFSPGRLAERVRRSFRDWDRLIEALPRDLADILRRIRHGSFDVNLNHRHLESSVNRLVMGVIVASLFVSSSLLLALRVPLVVWDVSLSGAAGLLIGAWLGFRLIVAIKRAGDIRDKDR